MIRPALLPLTALTLTLALAACGSSPPVQHYRLPSDAPAAAPRPAPATGERWLLGSLSLPDYLDRNSLMVPVGRTGLQTLPGQRWAEPLRDALPRVLRADLARLRGADRIWMAPLPPGVKADRVLKLDIQAFEATAEGRAVQLDVRWWLADPTGQVPATARFFHHQEPCQDGSADALVAAHRAALWALAQALAAEGGAAPTAAAPSP